MKIDVENPKEVLEDILTRMNKGEIVERKKGKWINYQGNTKIVLCSECRTPALESMTGCLANQHLAPSRTNFCPNCGADMREEKNDGKTN